MVKNVDTPRAAHFDTLCSRKIAALGTIKGKSYGLRLPLEAFRYISPEEDVSKIFCWNLPTHSHQPSMRGYHKIHAETRHIVNAQGPDPSWKGAEPILLSNLS